MSDLAHRYRQVRRTTLSLCASLEPEDYVVQTMPDVSPAKWHLAHVTWFFERFVLEPELPSYQRFNDDYHYLFNSYYQTAGQMHPRPLRGQLTRPTVRETRAYRDHVDEAMARLLQATPEPRVEAVIELGLNHEQQHQELMLTDIKHVFSCNPLEPAVRNNLATPPRNDASSMKFLTGREGVVEMGHQGTDFAFDNESPRHQVLLQPHELSSRLVSNGEFREFIRDGGYEDSRLWLADGWATVNQQQWRAPLYWSEDLQSEFTLGGRRDLDLAAPVCHVSLYEADAFARWAEARLPTEFEWESAAGEQPVKGNLLETDHWHPVAASEGCSQWFGDVWEWTSSSYAAYPGFQPLSGSLGEYNGKFMCNQATVRGGSCVTSSDHVRASYRSFFYPHQGWQFLGIRLARDTG